MGMLRVQTDSSQGQIFSAWPISAFWTVDGDYDMDYYAFITAFAAMDIALDLIILCLPLTVIKNLNITKKRKILLAGVFWLGLLYAWLYHPTQEVANLMI